MVKTGPGKVATLVLIGVGIVTADKRIFWKYMCPFGMVFRFFSAIPFPAKYRLVQRERISSVEMFLSCLAALNTMHVNTWRAGQRP